MLVSGLKWSVRVYIYIYTEMYIQKQTYLGLPKVVAIWVYLDP